MLLFLCRLNCSLQPLLALVLCEAHAEQSRRLEHGRPMWETSVFQIAAQRGLVVLDRTPHSCSCYRGAFACPLRGTALALWSSLPFSELTTSNMAQIWES